jgi:multidrug efflux pump subunit AcrA (membrane-fusion protein)
VRGLGLRGVQLLLLAALTAAGLGAVGCGYSANGSIGSPDAAPTKYPVTITVSGNNAPTHTVTIDVSVAPVVSASAGH